MEVPSRCLLKKGCTGFRVGVEVTPPAPSWDEEPEILPLLTEEDVVLLSSMFFLLWMSCWGRLAESSPGHLQVVPENRPRLVVARWCYRPQNRPRGRAPGRWVSWWSPGPGAGGWRLSRRPPPPPPGTAPHPPQEAHQTLLATTTTPTTPPTSSFMPEKTPFMPEKTVYTVAQGEPMNLFENPIGPLFASKGSSYCTVLCTINTSGTI